MVSTFRKIAYSFWYRITYYSWNEHEKNSHVYRVIFQASQFEGNEGLHICHLCPLSFFIYQILQEYSDNLRIPFSASASMSPRRHWFLIDLCLILNSRWCCFLPSFWIFLLPMRMHFKRSVSHLVFSVLQICTRLDAGPCSLIRGCWWVSGRFLQSGEPHQLASPSPTLFSILVFWEWYPSTCWSLAIKGETLLGSILSEDL